MHLLGAGKLVLALHLVTEHEVVVLVESTGLVHHRGIHADHDALGPLRRVWVYCYRGYHITFLQERSPTLQVSLDGFIQLAPPQEQPHASTINTVEFKRSKCRCEQSTERRAVLQGKAAGCYSKKEHSRNPWEAAQRWQDSVAPARAANSCVQCPVQQPQRASHPVQASRAFPAASAWTVRQLLEQHGPCEPPHQHLVPPPHHLSPTMNPHPSTKLSHPCGGRSCHYLLPHGAVQWRL